jgi:Cytochrome b(C-terminal)/b6/petD
MQAIKNVINWASSPQILFTIVTVAFILALRFSKVWTKKSAAIGFSVVAVFYFVSMFDPNFFLIVAKPDNIPITFVLFLVAFFTWFAMYQGVENDKRIAAGETPQEKKDEDKVWVWPDLVYVEFLCMILLGIGLMVWSILAKAPIEQPANPANSPNPSKAPWYFLGLQEMLVYYDPWLAGVVFPTLIIVGLMAIPYIDTNPKGNGYFTFKERKAEIGIFLYGFLVLWVLMVISGTFLRGPNWNFFGPYEFWDPHRVEPLLNVHVSDFFWVRFLGRPLPSNPIVREFLGILIVAFYIGVLPVLLSRPKEKLPRFIRWVSLNGYYVKMGPVRYYIGVVLFLLMLALPIKMYLRWLFNLKYIMTFPEIFFNI